MSRYSQSHLGCVLLCFINPRVRKIRNEAFSCRVIFSRTLRFYYVATARSVEDETSQNRENQISLYLTVQSRIEILIGFEFRGVSRYKFKLRFMFNLNLQLTKISPPFRISIRISSTISSLIFQGTRCGSPGSPVCLGRLRRRHSEDTNLFPRVLHKLGSYSGL